MTFIRPGALCFLVWVFHLLGLGLGLLAIGLSSSSLFLWFAPSLTPGFPALLFSFSIKATKNWAVMVRWDSCCLSLCLAVLAWLISLLFLSFWAGFRLAVVGGFGADLEGFWLWFVGPLRFIDALEWLPMKGAPSRQVVQDVCRLCRVFLCWEKCWSNVSLDLLWVAHSIFSVWEVYMYGFYVVRFDSLLFFSFFPIQYISRCFAFLLSPFYSVV